MSRTRALSVLGVVLVCLLPFAAPRAQVADVASDGSLPATPRLPQGEPEAGEVLRDRDFGVTTGKFGLDRQVEMYQWDIDGQAYRGLWNAARIDSSRFPAGYENPPFLMKGERWWSHDATLDGYPIDDLVLQAIGEWRPLRPNFSRLPLNMAATFQPEGDGLGSAENPLEPRVGDLRITWRELHLPPLPGRVELRDGVWQLSPRTAAAALNASPLPPALEVPGNNPLWQRWWPWLLGAGALLLVLTMLMRRLFGRAGRTD